MDNRNDIAFSIALVRSQKICPLDEVSKKRDVRVGIVLFARDNCRNIVCTLSWIYRKFAEYSARDIQIKHISQRWIGRWMHNRTTYPGIYHTQDKVDKRILSQNGR